MNFRDFLKKGEQQAQEKQDEQQGNPGGEEGGAGDSGTDPENKGAEE